MELELTADRIRELREHLSPYDHFHADVVVEPAQRALATGARTGFTLGDLRALCDIAARVATWPPPVLEVDVVLDGPPSQPGRFVEVETREGHSVAVGEWVQRDDGYWALRLNVSPEQRR